MDELELVRELYGPQRVDPRVRARVWGRIEAERRRGRRRLFSWSVGLVATGAFAVWLAIMPATQQKSQAQPQGQGRMVLLAAAGSAGRTAGGAFWHLRQQRGDKVTELWAARDGRTWVGDGGKAWPSKGAAFSIAGRDLTFAQIQRLPSDEAALKAWVVGMLPVDAGDDVVADAVLGLLWRKPSPPGVRAAAYRLLADLPNVRYLGERADRKGRAGEQFAFTVKGVRRTVIIDPASSQVLSCTDDRQADVLVEAGFTSEGP
ncbi:hypothetical protein ACIBG8_21985 [Nonomuraea sp. NPDC050556]|uniref:hypothetical protein n=1 Tax=Nonomuraea sp. NPDC050556 TaxID=3364369 RepID=UPI0037B94803